ncbi:hypothetical protein F2Q68_00041530 [Brassica cretica]|uniref:Uncharacterized protein n=1 Tax=Brassica cretica TaxID=69181 RepID=A0A8S9MQB9_BRACR|nr:hypothetical protein F2Q68_00041530 [Brassica cretica]
MELEVGIKEGNWNRKELGLRSSTGRTRSPEVENPSEYQPSCFSFSGKEI